MRRVVGWTDGDVTCCRQCAMECRPFAQDGAEAIRYGDPDARQECESCGETLETIARREEDGPNDNILDPHGVGEVGWARNH
jgi:hypothetical protein